MKGHVLYDRLGMVEVEGGGVIHSHVHMVSEGSRTYIVLSQLPISTAPDTISRLTLYVLDKLVTRPGHPLGGVEFYERHLHARGFPEINYRVTFTTHHDVENGHKPVVRVSHRQEVSEQAATAHIVRNQLNPLPSTAKEMYLTKDCLAELSMENKSTEIVRLVRQDLEIDLSL